MNARICVARGRVDQRALHRVRVAREPDRRGQDRVGGLRAAWRLVRLLALCSQHLRYPVRHRHSRGRVSNRLDAVHSDDSD